MIKEVRKEKKLWQMKRMLWKKGIIEHLEYHSYYLSKNYFIQVAHALNYTFPKSK